MKKSEKSNHFEGIFHISITLLSVDVPQIVGTKALSFTPPDRQLVSVTPGSGHFVTVTDSPDPTVTMADKMIERMKSYKPVWEAIIDQSFLPEQMKTSYCHLLNKRIVLL